LFADGFAQSRVSSVKALRRNHLACDIVSRHQRPVGRSERVHTEPGQLIARKVPGAPGIGALRLYLAGVSIWLEQPQHAVYVREIRAVLFQLAFQLFDEPGDERSLLSEGGNDA
jgi:hypothetical protein